MKSLSILISAAAILGFSFSSVYAQGFICPDLALGSLSVSSYHGYSKKPANNGNIKGQSTIRKSNSTFTDYEYNDATGQCEIAGTRTTASENYVDGPGNSKYEKRNPISSSCEATGTLSCP